MTLLDRIVDFIRHDFEALRIRGHIIVEKIEAKVETAVFGPRTDAQMDTYLSARCTLTAPDATDWRNSIVDLLKILGFESNLDARMQLAGLVGYGGKIDGSAESNIALHHAVMRAIRGHLNLPALADV